MRVEQISIFLENRTGRLAEVTSILSEAGVNIRALAKLDKIEIDGDYTPGNSDASAILKDLEDLDKGFSICALNKANYSIMESLQLHQIISIYQLEIDALNAVKNNNK